MPKVRPQIVCKKRMDVAILIDGSGSVKPNNFKRLKRFLIYLVKSFKIGYYNTRVALVQFSTNARVEFYLKSSRNLQQVINAIKRLQQMRRRTYINRGLQKVRTRVFQRSTGDRAGVPNTLILLTDGKSRLYSQARGEALRLKRQGVRIVSIGIGKQQTIRKFAYQIRSYSSRPLRGSVFLNGFRGLKSIFSTVALSSCKGKVPFVR